METREPEPKPARWAASHASAFQEPSVVESYHLRPPYPESLIEALAGLAAVPPGAVLDVGTGTGELARRLVGRVARVDAVDPSAAMIARGRTLAGGDHPRLHWILGAVETAPLTPPYALIMGGSSLHWLQWEVAFPLFERLLAPGGVVAIVRRSLVGEPWRAALRELEGRYAPERGGGERPDLAAELERRRLFRELGRFEAAPAPFTQSVEDYVGAIHSRSAFARERMAPDAAAALDRQVRDLVTPWSAGGVLTLAVAGSVVWGRLPG